MILLSEVDDVESFEWGPIEKALQHLPNYFFLKESGRQCLFFYQPLQYAMTNESSNCFLPLVLSFFVWIFCNQLEGSSVWGCLFSDCIINWEKLHEPEKGINNWNNNELKGRKDKQLHMNFWNSDVR